MWTIKRKEVVAPKLNLRQRLLVRANVSPSDTSALIRRVLALWRAKLVADEDVVGWADRMISAVERPSEPLIELSLKGPREYLFLPGAEVPKPEPLSFEDEFSLRAAAVDLASSDAVTDFTGWLAGACLGGDMDRADVMLGHVVYLLWVDHEDMEAAIAEVRKLLPPLLPACAQRATAFWSIFELA
jgi:hypothetical protein